MPTRSNAAPVRRDIGRLLDLLAAMEGTKMVERSDSARLEVARLEPSSLPAARRERLYRVIDGRLQPGPYLRWLALIRLICERWNPGLLEDAKAWRKGNDKPASKFPRCSRMLAKRTAALGRA